MDISAIITNLRAQVKNAKIALDETLLSSVQLNAIRSSFGLGPKDFIVINGVNTVPDPVGDSVTISTGTVDIFAQKGLGNIQLSFIGGADTNLIFYIPMPSGWKINDSFPTLTLFPFNLLALSETSFTYSTIKKADWVLPGKKTAIQLSIGLNLNGLVTLKGFELIASLLGSQFPAGLLNISGLLSKDPKNPYPVMKLNADLGIPKFTIVSGLELNALKLLLEVTVPDKNNEQGINFGIRAETKNLLFDLIILDGGGSISFIGGPQPGFNATLANLATTELSIAVLPGVDFSSLVPDPIAGVFTNAIAFKGFSALMSLSEPRKITSISFSIGQASGVTIDLGLFKLTGFTFEASWISPGSQNALTMVSFKASGKVPINIFKEDFNFRISASGTKKGWEIDSIYADYAGRITMADILLEISPNSVIPDFLKEVSFTNFVASAKPGEQQFMLACMGEVGIHAMDQNFVASFALILNKTASQTKFQLNTQFGIGNVAYTLNLQLANSKDAGSSFSAIGTAKYTGRFDMDFSFRLEQKKAAKSGSVYTVELKYAAKNPPKLSDFLELMADTMGMSAPFPGGLDIDAEMDALTLMIVKDGDNPLRIDTAGLFKITVEDLAWDIYLSYTNNAYFETEGASKRALAADGSPVYVLGVALSGDIGLEKLPLVGKTPGVSDLTIKKLGFYYTDAVFSAKLKKLIFTVASLGTTTPLSPSPDTAFLAQPEFSLMAMFGNKNENSKPNALPLPVNTGSKVPDQPPFQKTQSLPKDPISWLDINKTFGPVNLIKVGLSYEKPGKNQEKAIGIVGLYLTGAFSVGGLSMVLDQLGVTFPIPKPGSGLNPLSEIDFHLAGMFLEYKTASFHIAGGFLNLPGASVNMIGEFIVQFGNFGLQAYGGYSNQLSSPSLFIFLHINAPMGGPPFFFINGISGGFGVNRDFKLPDFDQLSTYPLLPSSPAIPEGTTLAGKSPEDKLKEMTNALVSLASYFPVEEGQYWLAAGLDVSSFEMIKVSAILSVAFGVNLQIAVVGSASMTIPVKVPEPIAFIQINFEVAYSTSSNMLVVMGVITPSSFIYSGLVHLSGGFAFQVWFAGPHNGDFVLTVGGYNSHYPKPDNYPSVPRIEMRAGIGPVNMVGRAYFALVPGMMMAGMDIKATVDLGPISAWFSASLDFILAWKPFHYEIAGSVEIGASFTIDLGFVKARITIHVGVFLYVWGPSFGGRAKVDLDIITFTIYFGADPKPAPLLDWTGFKEFLPSVKGDSSSHQQLEAGSLLAAAAPETTLVNILVKKGLAQSFEPGHEIDGLNWIVDANDFDIRTQSTAPVTHLNFNGTELPQDYKYLNPKQLTAAVQTALDEQMKPPFFAYATPEKDLPWDQLKFGIPSMGLTDIKSTHIVSIKHLDNQGKPGDSVTDLISVLNTAGVPPSLWGNEPIKANSVATPATVIPNALVELSILPMIWFPKRTTFIPYYYLVFDSNNLFLEQNTAPVLKKPDFSPAQEKVIYQQMQNGTGFEITQGTRAVIVDLLALAGFDQLELINSEKLSTQDYQDDPLLIYMNAETSY